MDAWPNKSPEPTAVGAVSSAVAVHVASRRGSAFRWAARSWFAVAEHDASGILVGFGADKMLAGCCGVIGVAVVEQVFERGFLGELREASRLFIQVVYQC